MRPLDHLPRCALAEAPFRNDGAPYFSDTHAGVVCASPAGSPAARSGEGKPDGLAVDRAGRVTVAIRRGSRLAVFAPDGTRPADIPVPVRNPTSCAFGGDLRTPDATTMPSGDEDDPRSGRLLAAAVEVPGLPSARMDPQDRTASPRFTAALKPNSLRTRTTPRPPMPKSLLAASLCLGGVVALATAAQAKTFKLGDDGPVASVDIPDGWEPSEIDDGVEATSPDKETYVAAEIVDGEDVEDAVKAEAKFFKKQKIALKTETLKKKAVTLGALSGTDYQWEATDEDGPTHVSMTMLKVSEKKLLMLTYWGSPAGEKSNGAALNAIAGSLKAAK